MKNAKEQIRDLLNNYELLVLQNWQMKLMLTDYEKRGIVRGWQKNLELMAADREVRAKMHQLFQPLYEQLDRAVDEAAILEILRKVPATGKVN